MAYGHNPLQHQRGGLLAQPQFPLELPGYFVERYRQHLLPFLRHRSDALVDDCVAHTHCRVCGSPLGEPYLDLGVQPLANGFLEAEQLEQPEFTAPLQVALCATCGLSQLTVVVAPERLYTHYVYASGVSLAWRDHCERLARAWTRTHPHSFVLELAANDGSMLEAFQAHKHRVLGIEPAQNITQKVRVPMLARFWDATVARQVAQANGLADLIVATNVLGHVHDVRDFLTGARVALATDGAICIECPHVLPLLTFHQFDTIYHEHLSYWSLQPLQRLARDCGLFVYDCQPQLVHGGTMRYWLCHVNNAHATDNVAGLWKREAQMHLGEPAPYAEFNAAVAALKPRLAEALARPGLHGFGASAKGNTLLNYVGATLPVIYDEGALKQGLYTPGRHIPVVALPATLHEVEALALLPWNWAMELRAKARDRGFRGQFLTPLPAPHWN